MTPLILGTLQTAAGVALGLLLGLLALALLVAALLALLYAFVGIVYAVTAPFTFLDKILTKIRKDSHETHL